VSDAKSEILARVRGALRDVPPGERAADVAVARDYRRVGELPRAGVVDLFAENCAEYRATVVRVADADALAPAIATALAERSVATVAIPADLPAAWRVDGAEWIEDRGLSHDALSQVDGVVTGCAVAIAQNGTLVLDGGAAQGRRALTLLPDYHLCVVAAEQVVELVAEGIERLHESARAGRPMTMIAGPSATSDIELNRVEGVHGPRTLDVLIVG
jgi:L-lactate dehydrogenase complex protein LldG